MLVSLVQSIVYEQITETPGLNVVMTYILKKYSVLSLNW